MCEGGFLPIQHNQHFAWHGSQAHMLLLNCQVHVVLVLASMHWWQGLSFLCQKKCEQLCFHKTSSLMSVSPLVASFPLVWLEVRYPHSPHWSLQAHPY